MKKFRTLKNKIILGLLALVMPLCAMGIILLQTPSLTYARETYSLACREEQSMTNNNFSSGVTNFSLNDSFTGWNSYNPNGGKATSGVITTGSRFQDYGSNRFYLRSNPSTAEKDSYILMINSKHSKSVGEEVNKGYYNQNNLTLDANSYYYFQVAFASDSNYTERTEYEKVRQLAQDDYITQAQFGYSEDGGATVGFNKYIRYTPPTEIGLSGECYIYKELVETEKVTQHYENVTRFYQDEDYFGFILEETTGKEEPVTTKTPVYVENQYVGSGDNGTFYVNEGAKIYTCPIKYDIERKEYLIKASDLPEAERPWIYKQKKVLENENYPVVGSMYVAGLKDEDGKDVDCSISSTAKFWTNFYFFVATGNESQSVNLELWLGSRDFGSSGVVFYDACHLYKCSENYFWDTYKNFQKTKTYTEETRDTEGNVISSRTKSCVTIADLRKDETLDMSGRNFDFEDTNLEKYWKRDFAAAGGAQIYHKDSGYELLKDNYVGTNLSKQTVWNSKTNQYESKENNNVLVLSADKNYSKITTIKPIEIDPNAIYKIRVFYKVSNLTGSAYVSVAEDQNYLLETYSDLKDNYSFASETLSSALTSNGSDNLTNRYSTVEFYVKGGPLFKSAVNLSLSLGKAKNGETAAETATGYVFFDDITIERATTEEYNNGTNKIELGSDTKTEDNGVTNGSFDNMTTTSGIPTPDNWTAGARGENAFYGVVNTDTKFWTTYFENYNNNTDKGPDNPYYWANFVRTNPGRVSNRKNQTNNVLMLANVESSYQSISSSNISLETGYKTIAFDYYVSNGTTLNVDLIATNGEFSIYNTKVVGESAWKHFEVTINVENSTEICVKLSLGTNSEKVKGSAFFDNFSMQESTLSAEEFEELNPNSKADLGNFYYNLQTNKEVSDLGQVNGKNYPAYVGSATSPSQDYTSEIKGGLVKGEAFANGNYNFYKSEMKDKTFFYISVQNGGSYTIDSNYSFDLSSDNYYKLSFKLLTKFHYETTDQAKDKDTEYHYGATVGLTGFDYMTEIDTSNVKFDLDKDGLPVYSIYFHPDEATTAKLHIALVCNDFPTSGYLVLCDLNLDNSITSKEYETAQSETSQNGYVGTKYVAKASGSEDAQPDDDTDSDTDTDTTTPASNDEGFNWLLIPSLITALAIVIAVVGFILRKIKIKKIEKKRKETYDRKGSINIDAIKKAAKQEQEKEIAAKTEEIGKFEAELEKIEAAHKQKIIALRSKDGKKVSKSTDKEFKTFAQKRTVIAERIETLKKQKDELTTPEHLLSLERKFYVQDEMKRRELEKASAKINKEREKSQSKNTEKTDKTDNKTDGKKSKK